MAYGPARTFIILGALVGGVAIGAALAVSGHAVGAGPGGTTALNLVVAVAEPVGAVWLNGLRMTIVPLVFALIFTGIASAAGQVAAGGAAARAMLWFAGLLLAGATYAVLAAPALLDVWPVARSAAAALVGHAPAPTAAFPPISEWLLSFVPTNPVAAAANGAMVPIVVFAVVFGFAATRIPAAATAALTGLFDAVVQAMLVIVEWVLWLAPAGVFALSLVVGSRLGVGAFGVLGQYIAVVCIVEAGLIALIYLLAVFVARVPLGRFARAVAPAQLVAISTQSSVGTLPAMIEAADGLDLPQSSVRLVLPLAVSLFRITSPAANLAVVVYVAALHGLPLGGVQLAIGVLVAVAVSLAAVGLPGQTSFVTSVGPICVAMNVPLDVLPLLLAVETIPDIFRTLGNVTADVAVTAVVARGRSR
ncbi:MAG: dicarboxylate/amino acid:cation symporter [Janthinobacterium lividum]